MQKKRHKKQMIFPVLFAAILAAAALPASLMLAPPVRAQDSARSTEGGTGPLENELDAPTRTAVAKGLEWLKARVGPNGEISEDQGNSVAIVALTGIAFLANGSMPNDGPYGDVSDKILSYVLDNCQPSGLVSALNNGEPMYGHGFATLYLAEVYGMSRRPDVGEKLRNAIRLIINTQQPGVGGWRYQPQPYDSDLSVTICQIMALRAARNAGVEVPNSTIQNAIDYVRKSQNPDGGFRYVLNSPPSAFPRSAAGVACLYYMRTGEQFGDEIKSGIAYLTNQTTTNMAFSQGNFYYGNYYATQAMFMYGGDAWKTYWPAIRKTLLQRQQPDGSWSGENGNAYCTAMSLIMLQVPNRLLPVLQK